MPELSDTCLRCDTHITAVPETDDPMDKLCCPPGSPTYFHRHQFSYAARDRARKKDREKLEAWTAASEVN